MSLESQHILDFSTRYRQIDNDELLRLWAERSQLTAEAANVLHNEMVNRRLTKEAEDATNSEQGASSTRGDVTFLLPALRYVGTATAFAVCGYLSAALLRQNAVAEMPIPFALLCALFFLRTVWNLLAVPLIILAWYFAYAAATSAYGHNLLCVCIGGFIGGLGLVLSVSTCHRRLFAWKYLFGGAVIGCISALPFEPWLYLHVGTNLSNFQSRPLSLAFGIWQATLGTYLYAICARASRNHLHAARSR